jgi:hypothetical protein
MRHRNLPSIALAIAATGPLLAAPTADAQDAGFGVTSRSFIEYNEVFTGGDDIEEPAAPDWRIGTDTRGFYEGTAFGDATWRAGLRFRGYDYLELNELDEFRIGPEVELRLPVTEADRLDIGLDLTYRQRGADPVSLGGTGSLAWTHRIDPKLSVRGTLEAGYTDYDESYNPNLDQFVATGKAAVIWRPLEDRSTVTAEVAYGTLDAELDRVSYDRYGIALRGRWVATEVDTVDAAASYTGRSYRGDYSAEEPFAREDDRWDVSVSYTRTVAPGVGLFVEPGYVVNDSNIAEESYDGANVSAGVNLSF